MNEGEPAVMWLSGLHIPESYLTALVQATCRKNGWPLDKSTLYTAVTKWTAPDEVTEKAHQGKNLICGILTLVLGTILPTCGCELLFYPQGNKIVPKFYPPSMIY